MKETVVGAIVNNELNAFRKGPFGSLETMASGIPINKNCIIKNKPRLIRRTAKRGGREILKRKIETMIRGVASRIKYGKKSAIFAVTTANAKAARREIVRVYD